MTGDLNGDGKTDMWCETGNGTGQWAVALSNGTSWTNTVWAGPNPGLPVGSQCLTADLNGDGKTDFLCETASGSGMWAVGISTGTSWANNIWAGPAVNLPVNTQCMTGDLNGDGKTDFFCQTGVGTGQWHTALSTGSSFANSVWSGVGPALPVGNQCFSGDLNGDGKTDFFCQTGVGTGQWAVSLSTGSSFISSVWSGTGPALPIGNQCIPGDFKGSGKTGFTCETGNGTGVWPTAYPVGGVVDLLSKVNNGIGGSTTITYEPSSTYVNNYLPFIVQTVSSIAVNDGNGNVSVTSYAFTGGLYDKVEREYRGFAYRRVINPIGTMSETWFKTDSVFKGLPYEQVVKDSSNNVYSRTSNTYNSTVVATGVVFPYLQQKDDYLCDGSGTCRQNAASFTYDVYGNVTRQYVHGDVSVSGDERDEYIEYNYDTARWIVAQPATTYVKDAGGVIKSQGWITYDTKGNVLTKTAWLSGGTNPVVTYTYDSFGNQKTITDARNNTSTIDYDSNGIYPVKVTNPLNQFGTKTYDPRFGVVLTETDANNNTTTYTYDVFGRLSTVTKPEEALAGLTTATYAYENFGTVGSQRVAVMMTEGAGTTAAPTCPTGGTYNPATNRCEAAPAATQYTCPVTGQIYSNQTACTNACVQTANCTSNATSITGTGIPFSYGLLTRVWANTSTQLCMSADDGWSNGCFTFPAGVVLSGDVDINTESRLFGWSYTYEKPYSLVGNGSTIDVYVVSYYCAGETCNQVSQPTLKGSITISGATVSSSIFDPTLSNGGITPSGASIIAGWNPGQLNFTLPPTYSCPLSGGSACSGSPMSCSVGQACTSFTPCPTGYTKSGNSCIATPTCPEGGTLNTTTDTCDVKNYVWKETYFDGMGRTIKTRNEGPDGKVIVNEAKYNNLGQTSKNSLPYFEGTETPRWTNMAYDAIGRVLSVTNPDNTVASKSYLRGRTTYVDTRGNVKVEEQDVYGRLVKVEEYSGVYPSQALYATTTYEYDIMGRLVKVTDAANNQTTMTYDTLGRKTGMTDPDMGTWSYAYDANGNMTSQTDAKNQTITFTYDALNRVTQKNYPTGTPVVYTYDETFAVNGKGRLTTVTDSTGSDKYYYDKHGRVVKNTQTIDATDYTTETTYDALNRVRTLKYPDGEIVTNSYGRDGGLNAVNGYVTYSDFTALGQPRTVTYANGVITNFQYNSQNNRLYSITTNSPTQGLQNISYAYDNAGNITTLTDHMDATNTQTFTYDHLSRLTQAQSTAYGTLTWEYNQIGNMTYNSQLGAYTYSTTKPHAVVQAGANVYAYDANGNMSSRKGVAITWNYDNKPSQMGTVQFAYDHSGARVKKIGATTTVYVGKLYECTSGVCTKYIFANGKRIASKKGTNTYYYHTDHLGSASVITDQNGNKVQQVYYYPFGKVRSNIVNGVDVKHKFTGQEEDAEYGLYYYNARYYDPELGRFISADTIVPNPHDPQDLNRYSYVGNNPLKYTDPTGHLKLGSIFKKVVGAIVGIVVTVLTGGSGLAILPGIWAAVAGGAAGGAVSAAVNVGNILKGAIFGAIGGAITGGAFYGAGEIMKGVTDPLVRAAGHAAAGAAVGAATSAIMGGDIGMGALTGFVSGGVSSLAGSLANGLGNTEQLLIRMGAGAVAGGATAAIAGGDVALGVVGGAIVGMAEHLFNKMMHPDDRRDPYKLGKFLVCGAGAVVGEGIYAAGKHALINAASYFGGEAIEIAPAAELAIKKSFQVSDGANAFFGKYETWGQRIGSRIDGCIDWAGGR
jgi:RHS repeat-associated protein